MMRSINLDIRKIPVNVIIYEMKYKFESSSFQPVQKIYHQFSDSIGKLIVKL